jgi:DNA-binding response OmpR family regulator/predicted ATPase
MMARSTYTLALGDVVVDLMRGVAETPTGPVVLPERERALLAHLAAKSPSDVGRDELLRAVWGDERGDPRRVDDAVRRLRARLGENPKQPRFLVTVHGQGYRLVVGGPPGARPDSEPTGRRGALWVGGWRIDLDRYVAVHTGGAHRTLSAAEGSLLAALGAAQGEIVPRAHLSRQTSSPGSTRGLDNLVLRVRRWLDDSPDQTSIETVRGAGYRLVRAARGARPVAATPLVGREALISALFDAASRPGLTTLTGPPGVGKTALSADLRARVEACGGATHWIDATAARSVDDLQRLLGASFGSGRGPAIADVAAAGSVLVVIDGGDRLLEPARQALLDWPAAAPRASFVVTLRRRLGAPPEVLFEVGPMTPTEALALYRSRVPPSLFDGSPPDRAAVRELVARLDHLPLAIVLSAARAATLSPREQLERLDQRFRMLVSRGGEPRSLADCIDWSWAELAPGAQALLADLSVFPADFDLADVEALLTEGGWLVDLLDELVRSSLVAVDPGNGRRRFRLLESIREFAAARLAEDRREILLNRLVAHEAAHTPQRTRDVHTPEAIVELDRRVPVIQLTIEHAKRRRDPLVRPLLVALARTTERRGGEDVLAAEPPDTFAGDDALAAELLMLRGRSCAHRRDFVAAMPYLERSVALALALGEHETARAALSQRGHGKLFAGDLEGARADFDAALAEAAATGAPRALHSAHANLGTVDLVAGRSEAALARYEQALAATGPADADLQQSYLGSIAHIQLELGRVGAARFHAERAVAAARQLLDQRREVSAETVLGVAEHLAGDVVGGEARLRDVARRQAALGLHVERNMLLVVLGVLIVADGRFSEAAALLREGLDGPTVPWTRAAGHAVLAALCTRDGMLVDARTHLVLAAQAADRGGPVIAAVVEAVVAVLDGANPDVVDRVPGPDGRRASESVVLVRLVAAALRRISLPNRVS